MAGAATYNIYRGTATNSQSGTPVATNVTAATYTNTGLTNGTTYFYKIRAVNTAGTGPVSNADPERHIALGPLVDPQMGVVSRDPQVFCHAGDLVVLVLSGGIRDRADCGEPRSVEADAVRDFELRLAVARDVRREGVLGVDPVADC